MINLKDKFKKAFGTGNAGGSTGKVVYSESRSNVELENYINDNLELLQEVFAESGLEFTYLPEWLDDEDDYTIVGSQHIVLDNKVNYQPIIEAEACETAEPDIEISADNNIRFREADPLTRKFEQLRKLVPDHVINQIFDQALRQREMLSRLVVGPLNKLILVDLDNLEIELRPIEMAFYMLYLKHQEGINFKDLVDHKDELWRYYKHATVTDDQEKMKTTLERLIDPFSGSADQHRSRIARAINDAIGDKLTPELARYYKLEGARGEAKKISLPQDKIIWKLDW